MIIYGLKDPRTGDIRYIGKANDPKARMKTHIRESQRLSRPVNNWISKLIIDGMLPDMVVIQETTEETWEDDERRIITLYRSSGRLLNLADGGVGPKMTTEQRANNGRKVAAIRDISWNRLTRDTGQCLNWLSKHGNIAKVESIRIKLKELARTCNPRFRSSILAL
jgi:hypothetical protein